MNERNLPRQHFFASKKPLRVFHIDTSLWKIQPNKRYGHYVFVPGNPQLPAAHPGAVNTVHATNDISLDHKELITLGESTINTLIKSGMRVCPRVIFLATKSDEETEDEIKLYKPHKISTYMESINKETQYGFTIHIAGHGNPEKIGSINPDNRLDMELFADLMTDLLKDVEKTKKIQFVFHTCNSAYVNLNENMSDEEIKYLIQEKSLIGKFAKAMKENEFTNITVTGYRGFYCHMASNNGSVVTSELGHGAQTLPVDNVAVTILPNSTVILPKSQAGKTFEVRLPDIQDLPAASLRK